MIDSHRLAALVNAAFCAVVMLVVKQSVTLKLDPVAEPVSHPAALKVTALTEEPEIDAVSVLGPLVEPIVHAPTVATPLELVVAAAPVTDPPPLAMANVTGSPEIPFPDASFTVTLGAVGA